MNNNVWIPQDFNERDNLTIFKFCWIFLFLEGGGFVAKLVAVKVIRQHMFFLYINLFLR